MGNKKQRGNGQGTIYQDKDGILHGLYFDVYGARKHIKQRKNENKTQFKDRFNETRLKAQKGIIEEKSNATIEELLKEYIEYKHSMNITKDRAYKRDKDTFDQLRKHCEVIITKPIIKVTVKDIQEYTPTLTQYAQNTLDKQWRMLKKAFKLAQSKRIITFNIMDNEEIVKPKSKKPTRQVSALSIEEQKRLIEILKKEKNQNNYILLVQLFTGMRIGEVLALSRNHVDLKNNEIHITRTLTKNENDKTILGEETKTENGKRTIPIPYFIKDILVEVCNKKIYNIDDLIFYNYIRNEIVCPNGLNAYLSRINKRYNISEKLHTHMLRHTYATRFIEAGGSAKVLQKLLGHANIETTLNTYASVFDKFEQDENQKYIDYLQKIIG